MNTTKEKGITLISLVVTIVILLILVGISITMVVGQNGIFSKAEKASIETRGANVQEAVSLWKLEVELANQTHGGVVQTVEQKLEELKNQMLLTADEVTEILRPENTNKEITIGSRTIRFKIEGANTTDPEAPTASDGITKANKPALEGLNKEVTEYITWGNTDPYQRQEGTTIDNPAPSNWYDYSPTTEEKNGLI